MNRRFTVLIIVVSTYFVVILVSNKNSRSNVRSSSVRQDIDEEISKQAYRLSPSIEQRLKLLQDEHSKGAQSATEDFTQDTGDATTQNIPLLITPAYNAKSGTNKITVLIVSDFRSGSSLLGEVFNQNDDVFYMFEPLKDVNTDIVKAVEDIITCTPESFGPLRRNRQNGCGKSTQDCLNTINMTERCLKYPITAVKLIRLRSIQSISGLIKSQPNLYIIHSFRDPRGTINSRLGFSNTVFYNGHAIARSDVTTYAIKNMSRSLCDRYVADVKFGEELGHTKYVRITYEDLVHYPHDSVTKAYDLIGREPTNQVFDWLTQHLNSQGNSSENDKFGLDRNGTQTEIRWKSELSEEYVCAIEQECYDVIELLGGDFLCPP